MTTAARPLSAPPMVPASFKDGLIQMEGDMLTVQELLAAKLAIYEKQLAVPLERCEAMENSAEMFARIQRKSRCPMRERIKWSVAGSLLIGLMLSVVIYASLRG
ncbi:hypothetical protein CRM22_010852 [Opisthorchis felineus]|uniref:Uncharacterized protein n=1 Tax=Opisthorchis felineus TaxID=147828 RepID=A0A4V3SAT5_OPIFE|nr:hypothetical protein CRM22_010852 [Opisthorchis felineus]